MQSLELVKSSELIMVFRISKIHTNADFTFSNNTAATYFKKPIDISPINIYNTLVVLREVLKLIWRSSSVG